jgi:phosphoenolpyruvate synthase/pyruvate phosphate dikinase
MKGLDLVGIGTSACSGKAEGIGRIVLGIEEIGEMNQGDVLITEFTTPLLTLAIAKASAIVTQEGTVLSHAAIVAREMGIPCVVGVKGILAKVVDGDIVLVDAYEGKVYKKS